MSCSPAVYRSTFRSDNGPEFTAKVIRNWIQSVGTRTLYIESGSPWENGYCESFNGKLRNECLNQEIFYSLNEARIVIEQWRHHYNHMRPHSALGYRPPAPLAVIPKPNKNPVHQSMVMQQAQMMQQAHHASGTKNRSGQ